MLKRIALLVISSAALFAVGFIYALSAAPTVREQPIIAHGNWADPSMTVDEQTKHADLVVRVQVDSEPKARKLKQTLRTDASGPATRDSVVITPFTDTKMRVIEVYKGEVGQRIEVMQTGGYLPAEGSDPEIHMLLEGDPIFVKGTEHILFLKNISGDAIHAKGRSLYRTINPASRYEIKGAEVVSHADLPAGVTPPASLVALMQQIRSALAE